MKVLLIASSGGHYEQIMQLERLTKQHSITVVTEKTKILNKADFYLKQVNRSEIKLPVLFLYNSIYSLYILYKVKPDIIISTGALSCIPVLLLGKLSKNKIIFIESFAKINTPTLTGKLVYKFADLFIIQWAELQEIYPNAIYGGGIY